MSRASLIARLAIQYVVFAACLWFCFGCKRAQYDKGRDLVNAAGMSKQDVIDLLRKGAKVNENSSSTFGWTPLISAIYHRKEDIAEFLIESGADVNKADSDGKTPLLWAVSSWGDNTNLIRLLVIRGADPRIKNRLGSDAFDEANSRTNAPEIISILQNRH